MTDTDRELSLQDEDRLPWLEAVETDDQDENVSSTKTIGFVLAGLALLALGVLGVSWLSNQSAKGPQGDGTLIAAQEGDYKVKPDAPGGMKVEGQGDAAFKASEGAEANGKIDTSSKPEAPMAGTKVAPKAGQPVAASAKPSVNTPLPAPGGKLVAPIAPVAGSATGGVLVQFGAYGSEATANTAWSTLVARNPSLAKLTKTVLPAAVGGNTLYRLRANAGTAANAAAICGQVGNCIVVK
jgi:SPOR domain